MTDDERKEQADRYTEVIKDALHPLLSEKGDKGIVAVRLFFALAHGDGTISAGNVGVTHELHTHTAGVLLANIVKMMMDIQNNRVTDVRDAPKKG